MKEKEENNTNSNDNCHFQPGLFSGEGGKGSKIQTEEKVPIV